MPDDPIVRDMPDDRPDAPEIERRDPPRRSAHGPKAEPGGSGRTGGAQRRQAAEQKKRSPLPLIILGIVILIAAIAGGVYWWMTRNQETTDDAYTDGHAISISPQVSGIAVKLAVTDNQFVHALYSGLRFGSGGSRGTRRSSGGSARGR